MEILEITPNLAVLVPLVVALVGGIRMFVRQFKKIKKYEGVIAVVSSMALGLLLAYENRVADTFFITQGIAVGLMASGLYSGVKTVVEKKKK